MLIPYTIACLVLVTAEVAVLAWIAFDAFKMRGAK